MLQECDTRKINNNNLCLNEHSSEKRIKNKNYSSKAKMKFAEHLSAHITPEWRKQYINYEVCMQFIFWMKLIIYVILRIFYNRFRCFVHVFNCISTKRMCLLHFNQFIYFQFVCYLLHTHSYNNKYYIN